MQAKAVGLTQGLPVSDPNSLQDVTINVNQPRGRDILVAVLATAVNPIDTKQRQGQSPVTTPRILGFDAVAKVLAVGEAVTTIMTDDVVYYAGAVDRPGSDAQYQLVDERLVACAPKTWSPAQSAGLPLTTLTAWETLFEKLPFTAAADANLGQSVLIINGAGGVGSMAIQLAKWAGLQVITTTGKPETTEWVKRLGADIVLDYHQDLGSQLAAAGLQAVDHAILLHSTDQYLPLVTPLVRPLGTIVAVVTNQHPLPMALLKPKSLNFAWEFMFTKANYQLPSMATQGSILAQVAQLADARVIVPTTKRTLAGINAANLRTAHTIVETGQMLGKIVLTAPFDA
ncbi:zinc-binding alcohol dehydrogenase family protein [Lactiplantibacillus plantarum]|uniref:zinc-binding alcohol dehydrogenase family protein n=1 Tax=Lactiplantibacillus plantarum TaxID=1590 RepID=UPI000437A34D|nr:zinc-binding alcohol dehydrogenase family protein [Lactiplantibacillus plantarum]EYR70801.1 alcohol dehydrogenase [Lactiplantibacillus plantarum WHE 92]AMO30061.1 alcohol dehydrogenase [Lactiplantibacillus plantarum]AZU38932.1 alcohol dehydrogenase [Lactiplantibacillus plantarum]KZU55045.1 Bifunctional protein: zinc-containing alcoholdehydrogenase [Lactiplantibacillus plantarum]KZU93301.1 Bifunctional protein: zinc-containing alcoholdehydrogenase [Lactiplantibacillus plantarum]